MNLKSLGALISSLLKKVIAIMKKVIKFDTVTGEKSYENADALPSGTVNKLLRHDGTNWVASTNVTVGSNNISSSDGANYAILSTESDKGLLQLSGKIAKIDLVAEQDYGGLVMQVREKHPTTGVISSRISIGSNGVITLLNFAGTGTRPIGVDSNGAITLMTANAYKNILYVAPIATVTENKSYTNTILGLSGINLVNKIIGVQIVKVSSSGTTLSVIRPDYFQIYADNITTGVTAGEIVKIFITYID